MKLKLPAMVDRPESRAVVGGLTYWLFAFLVFPFMVLLIVSGPDISSQYAWIDIAYHGINFLVTLVIFLPYLRESAFMARFQWKKTLSTAALCGVAVTAVKITVSTFLPFFTNQYVADCANGVLLVTEAELLYFPSALIFELPLWGTLCTVLLTPFTASCLFYACVFAPICNNRPWLAYVVTAVALLGHRLLLVFCTFPFTEQMLIYLIQLPVHMLACWAYQKTDTVLTPIAVHASSNLILVILLRSIAMVL